MEDSSEQKKNIEISVLKGDKLFNANTPFVINLFAPEAKEQEEKKSQCRFNLRNRYIRLNARRKNRTSKRILKYFSRYDGSERQNCFSLI